MGAGVVGAGAANTSIVPGSLDTGAPTIYASAADA